MLVLKLVVDGTYLSLANRQQPLRRGSGRGGGGGHAGPGSMHHVCVVEMEWFELTLRLCDNSQFGGDYQKVHTYVRVHVCLCAYVKCKIMNGYECLQYSSIASCYHI